MSKNANQFFFNQVLEQGFYDSNADMGKLLYCFGSIVAICITGIQFHISYSGFILTGVQSYSKKSLKLLLGTDHLKNELV